MVEKSKLIRIRREELKKLKKIGLFGETYNDTIKRILKQYKPIKHERWKDKDLKIISKPIRLKKNNVTESGSVKHINNEN
jgi:hypothetical protein